jgi:hypothetical protein
VASSLTSTTLLSLRAFVANVLDYDPTNPGYARQIDALLNEAAGQICNEKGFTFAQSTSEVTAYKDQTVDIAFGSGDADVDSAPTAFFEDWMVNQELVVGGVTYIVVSIASATQAYLDRGFVGSSATHSATVINRYLDLPVGATTIMSIARRSSTSTPNTPGLLDPLTRSADEWENLALGETGTPGYWVPHQPAVIYGPRAGFTAAAAAAAGPGRGVRTVELCCTFVRGGRESPHGEIVSVTATDSQEIVLTPMLLNVATGIYKRYYWRCTSLGYQAFRRVNEPGTTTPTELAPTDVAPRTLSDLTVSSLTGSEGLYEDARLEHPDGFVQRVRLYPRQDTDYTYTIRYMRHHPAMQEDGDTSIIPPNSRVMIAYKMLEDALMKHDNPTQALMYKKKYEPMLLKLEARYIPISPSKRTVKGGRFLGGSTPGRRFTTLVHT